MKKFIRALSLFLLMPVVFFLVAAASAPDCHPSVSPATLTAESRTSPMLIGYWHNFMNAAGFLPLADVPSQFDIINIAFATPVAGSNATIAFEVNASESQSQFIADIALLHGKGKKVVLSIGGANAVIQLNSLADVQAFVDSVSAIIKRFGFDGIDIDFEGNSLALNAGDADFRKPATPVIVNLIAALHQLKERFGSGFIISMAPETLLVQGGLQGYGGQSGAYLPVIFGTRDILSYVQVQDYNSGTMSGLDGKIYSAGTADFHVAMTEMLLRGFPVAGNDRNRFPALPPGQVAFGVLAGGGDQGFTGNTDLLKALNYLIKGIPYGGKYRLQNSAGYPGLRGMMAWSINWDAANGFALSNTIGPFLHGIGASPKPSR